MASPQSLDAQQQVTINALASGWSTLPASKQEAAKSLVDWFSNKGFLTFKQWEFAHSLAAHVKPGKPNLNVQVNTAIINPNTPKPDPHTPYANASQANMKSAAPHADELMGVPNFTIGMEEELAEIEAMRLAMVGNPIATIHDGKLNWQSGDHHAQYHDKVGAEIAMADVKHHVKPGPALLVNEEGDFVTDPVGTQLQEDTAHLKALADKYDLAENKNDPGTGGFSMGVAKPGSFLDAHGDTVELTPLPEPVKAKFGLSHSDLDLMKKYDPAIEAELAKMTYEAKVDKWVKDHDGQVQTAAKKPILKFVQKLLHKAAPV